MTKWISMEDRLPSPGWYLVGYTWNEGKWTHWEKAKWGRSWNYTLNKYNDLCWCEFDSEEPVKSKAITHWMEINAIDEEESKK